MIAAFLAVVFVALLVGALQDATEGALPRYVHRRQYHGRHAVGYTPPLAIAAGPVMPTLEAPEASPYARTAT